MDRTTEFLPVLLDDGTTINIETTMLDSEEEVVFEGFFLKPISETIEGVSKSLISTVKKVSPTKASVELGFEVGLKEGQLTALLVQGDGKANIKVTLEWEKSSEKVQLSNAKAS